jgi:hypothetical protein
MTRLILTTSDSGAGNLSVARIADMVIPFGLELIWGPLPSEAQLTDLLAGNSIQDKAARPLWFASVGQRQRNAIAAKGMGFFEFCARCEWIELWVDPAPNAQLMLIWLLSCFRANPEAATRLSLVQANVSIPKKRPDEIERWVPSPVGVTSDHLGIASLAWSAYRAPTPQPWFDLLREDLSLLPQLRRTVLALLEELPWCGTGLGATEMRMLELIDEGDAGPRDVFPGHKHRNERRVFEYWAIGALLDALFRCPAPVVSGLQEGPFTMEMHHDRERSRRYWQSKLSLTPLGQAILAGRDDFSRHNPIQRWWGGTELTNDRLWCWDPAKGALVGP